MGRSAHRVAVVLLMLALGPTLALAQERSVGTVTTLAGRATVARLAAPQPVSLKFKDDVFLRDRINTAENSIVRVLLGGKALVTVRELTTLTVTEEVGRATVDLDTGKIGLAVAAKRLRPGEVIELRTPNAIVAVRGTVLVAEILRASAQVPPGPVAVVSNLYVLRGSIDVFLRAAPTAPPITVGAFQTLNITGSVLGAVRPIPPGAVAQIVQGLKAAPQHTEAPEETKAEVSSKEQGKAMALATALAPTIETTTVTQPAPTTTNGAAKNPVIPLIPEVKPPTTTTTNLIKNGSFESGDLFNWTLNGAGKAISKFGTGTINPFSGSFMFFGHTGNGATTIAGDSCTAGNPCERSFLTQSIEVKAAINIKFKYVLLTNEVSCTSPCSAVSGGKNDKWLVELVDSAGTTQTVFQTTVNDELAAGTLVRARESVSIDTNGDGTADFTLASTGGDTAAATEGPSDFRSSSKTIVPSTGTATLKFHVIDIENSANDSGGLLDAVAVTQDPPLYFLRDGSAFNRTDPAPLLQLSNNPQTFDTLMVVCCNSTASLAGPLLRATNSDLTVPFSLVSVVQGGTLASSSTDPLVLLEGGRHSLGSSVGVFDIAGVNTATDAVTGLTLGTDRPLRHAGAFLETSGATVSTETVLKLDTALLEASAPLLSLRAGSNLTTSTHAVDLSFKAKVTSLGALVRLDASTLNVGSGAAINLARGSVLSVIGDLIQLRNGSSLNILNGSALNVTGGSVLNVSGALVAFSGNGGNTVNITNSLCPCTSIGGIPVALRNGAVASNVSIANPIRNASLGSVQLSSSAAAVVVSGSTSKVTISGN